MIINDDKLAYTIQEVIKVTGISKTKLWMLIRDGRLTARKLGSRTLILKEDLRLFLDLLPTVKGPRS